ncbi:S1/P1 nuclease [Sordaria brevicollis]|uniref:S1/P1 nuclease n=1 Tax=Sordaria brevicollis TaxID=83679 RepID=A0AAE0PEG9_SORBR|nr:S1/P1 nuclease [Sordaria brevicollis]
MKTSVVLPVVLQAAAVSAWGKLGHATVASVAQQYLTPNTVKQVQAILSDNSTTYMGNIASWADSFRYEGGNEWSTGFHFVNGHDAPPPESCHLILPEDCPPEGCVVSAIGNYTERVQKKNLTPEQRAQALKFIIHFLGDIAQPLHTEAFGEGANNVTVTFKGYKTNLHAAWDTSIPNTMLGISPPTSAANITNADFLGWANNLAAKINLGQYRGDVRRWLRHHKSTNRKGAERAAAAWAQDGNEEVCHYVMKIPGNQLNGTEIGGDYYKGAAEVVERSIIKGGVRLAGWLNLIFDRRTGFEFWF